MIEISGTAADGIRYAFAGDTLNTAVYLARKLSGTPHSVDYLTALGDDPFSDRMLESWGDAGIGTELVCRLPGKLPGLYWISNSQEGERSFHYWRSESAARELLRHSNTFEDALSAFNVVYVTGVTMAIFDNEGRERLLQLLSGLRRNGATVVYDNNYRPALWESAEQACEWLLRLAALSAVALVSLEDERVLFGDDSPEQTVYRLREHGVSEIVAKDGENMCTATVGKELLSIPVETVEQVDTTAAGDSFNAAYIAARLDGRTQEEAVLDGQALAAKVIGHHGAIIPE